MSEQQSETANLQFGGFKIDISQFDFDDHSSRVFAVRVSNIVFIISVVAIVVLRIFARVRYVNNVFADDGVYL